LQISDENLHLVRNLMDEVFGAENIVSLISFNKSSGLGATLLPTANDYIVWYARDISKLKYRQLFHSKGGPGGVEGRYTSVMLRDGKIRPATAEERTGVLPPGARLFAYSDLTKPGPGRKYEVEFAGKTFTPGSRWWGVTPEGMERLKLANRIVETGRGISFIRFLDDFSYFS
jgi:adenine-specific DNA-methyltransferase